MKRIPFVLLVYVAIVSALFTAAVSNVGEPFACEPRYTWDLPIGVLVLLIGPAVAGYFIHEELNDKEPT